MWNIWIEGILQWFVVKLVACAESNAIFFAVFSLHLRGYHRISVSVLLASALQALVFIFGVVCVSPLDITHTIASALLQEHEFKYRLVRPRLMLMTLTFFEDYNHCGTEIITLFCTNGFLFSETRACWQVLFKGRLEESRESSLTWHWAVWAT